MPPSPRQGGTPAVVVTTQDSPGPHSARPHGAAAVPPLEQPPNTDTASMSPTARIIEASLRHAHDGVGAVLARIRAAHLVPSSSTMFSAMALRHDAPSRTR